MMTFRTFGITGTLPIRTRKNNTANGVVFCNAVSAVLHFFVYGIAISSKMC